MAVKIPITMEQQQLLSEIEKQKLSWGKVEKAVKSLGDTQDKEQRKAIRMAEAYIRRQRDDKEVLEDRIKTLRIYGQASEENADKARQAIHGLISAERERQKAAEKAQLESTEAYQQQQAEISKGISKVRELQTANRTLDSQYDELKRSIKAAFDAGEIEAREYEQAIKHVEDAREQAIGERANARLKSYLTSVGATAGAAWAGVVSQLERVRELQAEALASAKDSRPVDAKLASVFADNLPGAIRRADSAAFRLGLDRNASKNLLFDAKSFGFLDDFERVARASIVLTEEGASTAAGKVRASFPQLNADQALNLAFKASQISDLNPSALARSLPVATQAGRQIGASPVETFAIQSQLSKLKKSGDEAATSLRAFSRVAVKGGFGGEGFFRAIDKIRSLPQDEFTKLIGGNQEALEGLSDIEFFRREIFDAGKQIAEAGRLSGTEDSPISKSIAAVEALPAFQAAKKSQQTELRSIFTNERLALDAAEIESNKRLARDNASPNIVETLTVGPLSSVPIVSDVIKPTLAETNVNLGEILGGAQGARIGTALNRAGGFTNEQFDERTSLSAPQATESKQDEQNKLLEQQRDTLGNQQKAINETNRLLRKQINVIKAQQKVNGV